MKRKNVFKKIMSFSLSLFVAASSLTGFVSGKIVETEAATGITATNSTEIESKNVVDSKSSESVISNDSLRVEIGDLGQISVLNIVNNQLNNFGENMNFVLPNDTSPQNDEDHQWMGEMIFSYRTSKDGNFPEGREGFVEVDTNKTLAAGGSKTATDASANLASNPHIEKTIVSDKKVEIDYIGQDADSTDYRTMKGFDVESVYDMDTEDGSLLWSITLKNKSEDYIEFGDVGLPMPWNNKYTSLDSVYNERVTVHTFAGADSGYAYAVRCSGEGNYIVFTPVPESGARIEYIDNWVGSGGGVVGERSEYENWHGDGGGWAPGLCVYYIHSKDISKTGRGYYTDATSLILEPGESKTYQFKFSAVRAGDNDPQNSELDYNNASDSVEERELNMRSIFYENGMIDAIAVPGFQTAINMPTKLSLHYDDSKIKNVSVEIQCVHENDPFDSEHIPVQGAGLVNNSRGGECAECKAASEKCTFVETKTVDGEKHHIYELTFGCIGNNSVRVEYQLYDGSTYVEKFTQFEFNVLANLGEAITTRAEFVVNETQDKNPDSATFGMYRDWYFASGMDTNYYNHWGDDWSHDNINFITMKNYLDPDPEQVASIENYLIDFMWENYMKNTQDAYIVANYLRDSGVYSDNSSPYIRTFSEMMEVTGFFNMYRIQKAYPDLIEYRKPAEFYLEKAYGIYINRVSAYPVGFYGEQQVPDMIEALYAEGMTEEAQALQQRFAKEKGTNMATAAYPFGSEFVYDNTGEEGAYSASKALAEYYPDDVNVEKALSNMERAEWKTRAMRGIQPTWYHYGNPVFIGGESWWNFQYTASLAGSIMDDWLRYQDNGWDTDTSAWAQRVNYAAKLSNFNCINMGQISEDYIGNAGWRYTMYKGGHGAKDVYDYGTRVMNNGWNDFSGESDEGLYGSLLRISSDVVTDPIFGLVGYGSRVSMSDGCYTVIPEDGIGKRINIIDDKLYLALEQDSCETAVIDKKGDYIHLSLESQVNEEHLSKISLSGAGFSDGYYSVKLNGADAGQFYVIDHEGTAAVRIPEGTMTAEVTIEKVSSAENKEPVVSLTLNNEEKRTMEAFRIGSTVTDDGAPNGELNYKWEAVATPEGGEVRFDLDTKPNVYVTCTREGDYKVKLTVSDGSLSVTDEVAFSVVYAVDKNELKDMISRAENVKTSLFEDSTKEIITDAVKEAEDLMNNKNAVQAEIDLETAKLERIILTLPAKDGNLAYLAKASTSFVSDWESLDAVNDGKVPEKSYNPSISRYGTWGNNSEYETVTYTWSSEMTLKGTDIYLWYDGAEDNYTSGGISVPKEYYYEYLDGEGNWQPVKNASAYETKMDAFNKTTFDEITTTAIRVTMKKQVFDSEGVGIMEWRVYGELPIADKSELSEAIEDTKKLNESEYTSDSWDMLIKALGLAENVYNTDGVSMKEVEVVLNNLLAEKDNLIEKKELPYVDVSERDWFYDAVYYNYIEETMTGMDETHFGPYGFISRAQFALILYRLENEPEVNTEKTFGDIAGDEWYGEAVLWAAENGIVTGYMDGNFGPADMITREQMAVMMYRYAKYISECEKHPLQDIWNVDNFGVDMSENLNYNTFKDGKNVSGFAEEAMQWAVGKEIITGKEGNILEPQGNTARAEAAVIIERFMTNTI